MADNHIDFFEVGEYGGHFVEEVQKLVQVSPLVNVEALIALVGGAVGSVNAELEKVGVKRSDLRTGRSDTEGAAERGRKEIERFYSYLGSLDDDVAVDRKAFFSEGKMGALAVLKPGDVKSKLEDVLRGFTAPANAGLPEHAKWAQKLGAARDGLAGALAGKGSARSVSVQSTAGLVAAREEFLDSYNGVAKRLIRGLLASLKREEEMRLFFLDLQVNEGGKAKKDEAPPPEKGAAQAKRSEDR